MPNIVGNISSSIDKILNITVEQDRNIYIGKSNIQHMQISHPGDYAKYGTYLCTILQNPDYVGLNPNDNSIEYVKEFPIESEFVKVAVRITQSSQKYYARSLYVLNNNRVHNFIKAGTLHKLK